MKHSMRVFEAGLQLALISILIGAPAAMAADEATKQSGAAQTEGKTDPASSGDVQERGIRPGVGIVPTAPRQIAPVPFMCGGSMGNKCNCQGATDCFDMMSKGVCQAGTFNCPPNTNDNCYCTMKQP